MGDRGLRDCRNLAIMSTDPALARWVACGASAVVAAEEAMALRVEVLAQRADAARVILQFPLLVRSRFEGRHRRRLAVGHGHEHHHAMGGAAHRLAARIARDARALVDANPLGTAAGYGVNLALDRDASTRALGFARLQVSPVAAQLSRGKYEWQALAALAQALGDVRRLAWDLSLYTTQEYGFVRLPPEYTTGSSIMPNKRNPDVVELLRASVAPVHGAMIELQSLLSLPSGYQRDLQYTKGPFLRAMRGGLDALAIVPALLARMAWDPDRMRAAIEPAMYATDIAIEQAVAGVPFRDAYRQASVAATDAARTPEASLAQRVSPGASADLRLDVLRARRRGFD